jgi:hypothetical protein
MSRIRKNKKFIDPRYFMDEKMEEVQSRDPGGYDKTFDTAEADRTPEEVFEDEALELAERLGVDISVEVADDGKHIIVVNREEGPEVYNDPDEMYDALSKEEY